MKLETPEMKDLPGVRPLAPDIGLASALISAPESNYRISRGRVKAGKILVRRFAQAKACPGCTLRAVPTSSSAVRFLAMVMVTVILATVATPARAEADALAIAGLVSLAVAGAILVIYLIAAAGSDRASYMSLEQPEPVLLAASPQAP